MLELEIVCDEGFVLIRADQLASVTADDLRRFGMSHEQLQKLFAEGARLMRGKTAADRVRPFASQTLDGKWNVRLARYSELTDPPLDGSAKRKGVKLQERFYQFGRVSRRRSTKSCSI